ncbi:unnamed protein product [Pedinophyceae sp. YPF-701]|nr:unnamed protein product [Pedinophyceae sp. YPF-701]
MSAAGPCSRKVGQWEVGAQLGSGSFAVVWHAVHCETGVHAAIKEIPTARLTPKLKESLDSEIKVLGCVRHRNIVSLLDTIVEPDRIFLVLEYCPGGDLSDLIRRHGRLSEAQARRFMHQLGAGLKALRTHNLIHRDLKPQNLLLTTQGDDAEIKIADFGFARDLQPAGMADTLCGSPLYMAPEILLYHKYDARADLWSVGTILYEMLVGRPPFTGQNHIHLLKNIERREAKIPHSTAQDLSQDCQDLVARLLRRRPTERLTFQDFFAHPFMNEESSELSPLGSRVGGASPQGFGEQPPPFKLTADEWAELQQRGQQGVVDDANQQLSAIIESEYVVVSRPETPGGATRAHASDTGMVLRPPTVSAVSEVDPRAPGGESRAELADAKGVGGSPKSVPGTSRRRRRASTRRTRRTPSCSREKPPERTARDPPPTHTPRSSTPSRCPSAAPRRSPRSKSANTTPSPASGPRPGASSCRAAAPTSPRALPTAYTTCSAWPRRWRARRASSSRRRTATSSSRSRCSSRVCRSWSARSGWWSRQ